MKHSHRDAGGAVVGGLLVLVGGSIGLIALATVLSTLVYSPQIASVGSPILVLVLVILTSAVAAVGFLIMRIGLRFWRR